MDGLSANGAATAADTVMDGLVAAMAQAAGDVEAYVEAAKRAAAALLVRDGRPDRKALDTHQHVAHGLSWIATYGDTLREMSHWAARLKGEGRFGTIEALLSQILFAEYIAQLRGGIPMNQGEIIRAGDLGCSAGDMKSLHTAVCDR